MSDFRIDPNFPRHEINETDSRVQWAAVAVIVLLVAGLVVAASLSGNEPQTASIGATVETTGSGGSMMDSTRMPGPPQPRQP